MASEYETFDRNVDRKGVGGPTKEIILRADVNHSRKGLFFVGYLDGGEPSCVHEIIGITSE